MRPILQQTEHDEIAVPAIQFVEASAGHDIRHAGDFSVRVGFERERQEAVFAVEVADEFAGDFVRRRQQHDLQRRANDTCAFWIFSDATENIDRPLSSAAGT